MIHKLLAGHRSHIRSILSIMLCLALVCGTVASMSVFAAEPETAAETAVEETLTENTAGETTVATKASTEAESIASSESTGEASSEEVTETPTEEVTEAPTEAVAEGVTDSISEATTETESVSEEEISAKAESNTLSLGSSVSATADDGISLTATYSYSYTVTAGSFVTVSSSDVSNANQGNWNSSNNSIATVSVSNNTVTITGVAEGTTTITHSWGGRNNNENTATYTVTVTGSGSSSNVVTVYVFVAGYDYETGENFSQDMLDLLNVNTLDGSGYFAAGTLELDLSQLSGTTSSMITSDEEWAYVLGELEANLNTSNSITCPDNLIASYAAQVLTDTGVTQNQGYSGLWLAGDHSNITEVSGSAVGSQYWHLDIRFQTVTITYIYGENGITTSDSGAAYDGNTAGSKVFIQGATMNYTPTIEAPAGWKIVGYYTTSDFQEGTEWNAVNQPINEDTTVYIKIVPEDDVVINYVVAEGDGTVTNPSNNNEPALNGYEYFNPTTGSPVGSTAAAGTGYVFDGWYSDADCTALVSSDAHYTPTEPSDGWKEDDVYTYYAKFVPTKTSVTVKKVWDDNGSSLRPDKISIKLYADDATTATVEETITGSGETWEYTFTNLPEYNYSYEGGPVTTKIVYTAVEDAVANYSGVVDIGDDGNITITNTLSTAKLTIQKKIEGNAGITTKQFTFTVSYTNSSGESTTATYNLADGESNSKDPLDVKLGTMVTITETSGAYVATATLNGSEITVTETSGNSSLTFEINEDSTVVVTNTYNVYPDTGVNLDSVPYIALLCGVVVFGAVVLIRRRRRLL